MKWSFRFLFGPLAAAILLIGITGLAMKVPGYSHVRQTVSEIGEMGSPARIPFAVMLCAVGFCLVVFASALRDASVRARHASFAAYLTAAMAVSACGVGIFAFPHPLHGVFGLSELIGYQAPWILALAWRNDAGTRDIVVFSWIMAVLVWISIAINLSTLDRSGALWAFERPFYGLVQRSLFVTWFGWCLGIGILFFRRESAAASRAGAQQVYQ